MHSWEVETKRRTLHVSGMDLLSYPDLVIEYGPIKTSTHMLAHYGWKLSAWQYTPLHVTKTRPRVCITPMDDYNSGFRWKLRARTPFQSPADVFSELQNSRAPNKFSLTKYETKTVPVVDPSMSRENQELKRRLALVESELDFALDRRQDQKSVRERELERQNTDLKDLVNTLRSDVSRLSRERDGILASDKTLDEVPDILPVLILHNQRVADRLDWSKKPTSRPVVESAVPSEGLSEVLDLTEIIANRKPVKPFDSSRLLKIIGE